jgi:hypothetical protein
VPTYPQNSVTMTPKVMRIVCTGNQRLTVCRSFPPQNGLRLARSFSSKRKLPLVPTTRSQQSVVSFPWSRSLSRIPSKDPMAQPLCLTYSMAANSLSSIISCWHPIVKKAALVSNLIPISSTCQLDTERLSQPALS